MEDDKYTVLPLSNSVRNEESSTMNVIVRATGVGPNMIVDYLKTHN